MSSENLQARSSNSVLVYLDGFTVGAIKSVHMTDDYSPEPVSGIGSIAVVEYVPTLARHTITVNNMVLIAANLRAAGVYTLDGLDALVGRVFDILVVAVDGTVLRNYLGCSYASGNVEVTANQVLVSNGTFMALTVNGTGA